MDDSELTVWNMRRLFLLAALIGVITGFAAWGFRLLIGLIHNISFFGTFSTSYDANQHTPESPWGWLVIFAPVLGGLVVVWLIRNFAPEARGHGVPEVMNAIHYQRGKIRGIVSLVKALASSITIGTGGSLGREGPIIQISSAVSSIIAQALKLTISQRNLLIACGASGGIAATFNAPLGGILFSIELLVLSINSRTILPVITSSVIAANVGRYLIGPDPAFHVPTATLVSEPAQPLTLILYFPFAAIIGLISVVFIKGVYRSEDFFESLPINPYLQHILGMVLLGILFYTIFRFTGHYYVQGIGYATIDEVMSQTLLNPWFLLLLVGAKMLAILLTIGSGGSGGVFSPSLYLGALTGGFIGTLLVTYIPGLGVNPLTFTLVGMAAMVAATTSAPMTAAIMTYEMTLDYAVVLPVMIGVGVAYSVRRYFSAGDIYTMKLIRRGLHPPEGFVADTQSQLIVDDIMDGDIDFVEQDDVITGTEHTRCVVKNDQVVGVVNPVDYRTGKEFRAGNVMLTNFITVQSGTTLREILGEIRKRHQTIAIVSLSGDLHRDDVIGVFSPIHLMRAIADSSKIFQT